ncbi:MAG: hypothetical protein A2928_03190 [Candidatus Taylorbacteria bacterium RIFCSPLOWO2_01_FULL_45_15b]|uniref:CSD domain-containing protein n=1 Tax=Candidatus Taylorbacteria bacterium RIFCSPLOWO2_01_FULL_45_15b TaxID=1802319 RepID=A0A1G2NDU7_9BACT|nr:MAG: hypothetical protein A2928_03190 [Candidatus Taylorbacteria bacterium RIFCSPLOWO2_01_FULL_45_15b]
MKKIEFDNGAAYAVTQGFVKFYSHKGYGYIVGPNGGRDIHFAANAVREVYCGQENPATGEVLPDRENTLVSAAMVYYTTPIQGDQGLYTTVVVKAVSYKAVEKEMAKSSSPTPPQAASAPAKIEPKAAAPAPKAVEKPVYRSRWVPAPHYVVLHEVARFNGQFARNDIYAQGTMRSLASRFPRLAPNDPLAAGYQTGPIKVGSVQFYRREEGKHVPCKDPRPYPATLVRHQVRIMEVTRNREFNREVEIPDYGRTVKQVWMGNLALRMESSERFGGNQFTFEISSDGGKTWTEIKDPAVHGVPKDLIDMNLALAKFVSVVQGAPAMDSQPVTDGKQPTRKSAEKPTTGKKPVGMQKSDKARPTVLKGFDSLVLPPN